MARLMLGGVMARVELVIDDSDGGVIARCDEHSPFDSRLAPPGACSWTKIYDDLRDAVEYAADHADRGEQG